MRKISIALLLSFAVLGVFAQKKQQHKPKPYIDSLGQLYWNKHQPFYLRIATTPSDSGILLESKSHKEYTNPGYFDTEGSNYVRTRYAVDPQTRKAIVPHTEILWEVVADGIPPVSSITFRNAPHFNRDGVQYYGVGLTADIETKDRLSKVEEDFYSINNAPFLPYSQTLVFDKEGQQSLAAYGVDNVGNYAKPIEKRFTVDLTSPKTNYEIVGTQQGNIIASGTVVKLEYADQLSGVNATYYKLDDEEFKRYNGSKVPTYHLKDGNHTLVFYSVDEVENKEQPTSYKFYLDKLAPILASDILGDRFIVKDQIYFSGRTKLKLTAVDNKSGVKEVRYSIDGEKFDTYSQPFYLPSVPGLHIVRYFAVDNMENETGGKKSLHQRYQEYKHNVSKIYVDLTGPSLSYGFIGKTFKTRDTTFVNSKTKIRISGRDGESGLQYLSYSINGTQAETRYAAPFSLPEDGDNTIEIFGYDNVNNRNKDQFFVIVDNTPPVVFHTFSITPIRHEKSLEVYPKYVKLYLAATDALIGTDQIFYSVNGGPMKQYQKYITGFRPGEANSVTIRTTDQLQNTGEKEINFWVDK